MTLTSLLNSPVNFDLIHFLLWIKGPNKSLNFVTFVYSSENLPNSSCHFPNHKSLFLQSLHHSLVSCTFLAQTLYTLVKFSPLKCKFLRLSSARVKICQIPHDNFEKASEFHFRFFIITQNSSVKF